MTYASVNVILTALCVWIFSGSLRQCEGVRYPNTAFVMHTHDSPVMNPIVEYSKNTWLNDTNCVIVSGIDKFEHQLRHHHNASHHRSLEALQIEYNGNPGCAQDDANCNTSVVSHTRHHHYYGSHRALAGVLVANETFAPDWVHIFDDDNYINIPEVQAMLSRLDPSVPLLLTGLVGPSIPNFVGPNVTYAVPPVKKCRPSSTPSAWSCCLDTSKPCVAHVPPPSTQDEHGQKAGIYYYNASQDAMVLQRYCGDHENNPVCCRTGPWPEGEAAGVGTRFQGYPFKLDAQGAYCPHFAAMWPYGGASYLISRGMLEAIGHAAWEQCLYRIQCGNADVRIMQCLFNNGFSLHKVRIPGVVHGVKTMAKMVEHVRGRASRSRSSFVPNVHKSPPVVVHKPPVVVHKPPVVVHKPPVVVHKPPVVVQKPPVVVHNPPVVVQKPPTNVVRPPTTVYKPSASEN